MDIDLILNELNLECLQENDLVATEGGFLGSVVVVIALGATAYLLCACL